MLLAPKSLAEVDPHTLLAREPFIRQDRSNWAARIIDDYLSAANLRPRLRFELVTLDAVAVLVDSGFGVALVPDWSPPWEDRSHKKPIWRNWLGCGNRIRTNDRPSGGEPLTQ
ncbi:LysR substrate binding domain-containing protein [Rhizobium subbaraonis]|uniref:LysR substrate binding domain-containing protein n=1 Tax=Rhizobium subbaraonis TaxID=908946 RepID=A0A285UX05_9HYPH|nr:LysR substrate-binding domain-containing protein [Rhizobium subbaraonis]SOC46323.1 LysR substrate binding domain-containing protein [Rhizobium subbaraonis]